MYHNQKFLKYDSPTGTVQQNLSDIAERLAAANTLRITDEAERKSEHAILLDKIKSGTIVFPGNYLQRADVARVSTFDELADYASVTLSSMFYYMAANKCAISRSYDDEACVIDWSANMPDVLCIVADTHPGIASGEIPKGYAASAMHVGTAPTMVVRVRDDLTGMTSAIERIEALAYDGGYSDTSIILDFSDVKTPLPLMLAITSMQAIKDSGMAPWQATMEIDQILSLAASDCSKSADVTQVFAVKSWKDHAVLSFTSGVYGIGTEVGISVDKDFWLAVKKGEKAARTEEEEWACEVFARSTNKLGLRIILVNTDKLTKPEEDKTGYLSTKKYTFYEKSAGLLAGSGKQLPHIPCVNGDALLPASGGACINAEVVLTNTTSETDMELAFRAATRALLRVAALGSVSESYSINITPAGLFKYAMQGFGFTECDLLHENKSRGFWQLLARMSRICVEEAASYAETLGIHQPIAVTGMSYLSEMSEHVLGAPQFRFMDKREEADQFKLLLLSEKYWVDGWDGKEYHGKGAQASFLIQQFGTDMDAFNEEVKMYHHRVKTCYCYCSTH